MFFPYEGCLISTIHVLIRCEVSVGKGLDLNQSLFQVENPKNQMLYLCCTRIKKADL